MRILILTRTLARSGGMIIVSTLVRELLGRGYDVTFVAFKPHGTPRIPDNAKDLYRGIDVQVIDIAYHANIDAQTKAYIDAAATYLRASRTRFDKVVLDSWYIMMAGALAQVIHDPNVFHLVQRDPVFIPENDAKIWAAYALELAGLFQMRRIVVGRALANTFKERYGQEYPVLDIYVDDAYRQQDFTVRDRSPIRLLASAADFNQPWKGLEFLLKSLSRFSGHDFELTLVSSNPIQRDLSAYSFPISAQKAETPKQMRDLLLDHDVYVCTSTSESFCLALAEAVTLGMPAIALDSVGNRDYSRGDNFYFVEDKSQFLDMLDDICDIKHRLKLHAAARASMADYSIERMVQQFIAALGL